MLESFGKMERAQLKTFRVKELIGILQGFDPELPVYINLQPGFIRVGCVSTVIDVDPQPEPGVKHYVSVAHSTTPWIADPL